MTCSIAQAGESDADILLSRRQYGREKGLGKLSGQSICHKTGQIYLLSTVSVGPYGADIAPPQVKPEPAVQA